MSSSPPGAVRMRQGRGSSRARGHCYRDRNADGTRTIDERAGPDPNASIEQGAAAAVDFSQGQHSDVRALQGNGAGGFPEGRRARVCPGLCPVRIAYKNGVGDVAVWDAGWLDTGP